MARIRAPSVSVVQAPPPAEDLPGQRVTRSRAAKATAATAKAPSKAVKVKTAGRKDDWEEKKLKAQQAKKTANLKEKLAPRSGSTIWVGNLAPVANIETKLRELFSRHCGAIDELYTAGAVGQVGQTMSTRALAEDVHVYAFIRFKQTGTGRKALRLDRTDVCGRKITVKPSFSDLPEARAIAERWCAKKVEQNYLKEADTAQTSDAPALVRRPLAVAPTLIIDRSQPGKPKKLKNVTGANAGANIASSSLKPVAEESVAQQPKDAPTAQGQFKLLGYSFAGGVL